MEVCSRSARPFPATNFRRVLSLLLLGFFPVSGLCLCLLKPSAAQDEPAAPSPTSAVEPKSPKDAAQEPSTPPAPELKPQEQTEKIATKSEKKKKEHRGSILIAPLPLVSPAIGTGIIPVVGYIFPFSKNDKVSPPSTVGGGGLITNHGTRAWFFGGQLFLKEDRYEVTAGYGRGNLEYNLYGIGLVAGNAGLKLP
jgi:hypothetical protein